MSEDIYMAARLVAADYLVAYSSEAMVYHSHNLTPHEQFQRNYSTGFFLQEHEELLMGANEVSEGKKLVKFVSARLLREGRIGNLCLFFSDCAARFFGNRSGRAAAKKVMNS
jgi:rhamnosyltransferase